MPQFAYTPERAKTLERNPDYAVTIESFPGRVRVTAGKQLLADSTRAVLVRETAHAPVTYLPRDDVRMELLTPSERVTFCPFKGHAAHFHLQGGDTTIADVAWSYETPFAEVAEIAGLVAFYPNRVKLEVLEPS